jgi:hypothetical protein
LISRETAALAERLNRGARFSVDTADGLQSPACPERVHRSLIEDDLSLDRRKLHAHK